jgi:hypothetical protein
VIGMLPDLPGVLHRKTQFWIPLMLDGDDSRTNHDLEVFARLKPGMTLDQAPPPCRSSVHKWNNGIQVRTLGTSRM